MHRTPPRLPHKLEVPEISVKRPQFFRDRLAVCPTHSRGSNEWDSARGRVDQIYIRALSITE